MPADELRWIVTPDQVDLRRTARVAMTVARRARGVETKHHVAFLVLLVVLVALLAASTGPAVLLVVPGVGGLVWLLDRAARAGLERRLRTIGFAVEPFELTADPTGVTYRSDTAGARTAWDRYERATVVREVIALEHGGGAVAAVLPHASLGSPLPPQQAAPRLQDWIDAARA